MDAAMLTRRLEEIAPLRTKRVATDAPPIPADVYVQAARGEVATGLLSVEGHRAKKAYGVAVLEVPIARMWSAVNDEASKVEWTRLGYLEIISGENCKQGRTVLQYLPLSLVSDRWWVVATSRRRA